MAKVLVAILLFVAVVHGASLDKLRKRRVDPANTAACAAHKGSCHIGACSGTLVHNLCGAGAAVCCVPSAAGAAVPAAPVVPAAGALTVGGYGVDVSVAQSLDVLQCFLNTAHKNHHVTSLAGSGAVGPTMTSAQGQIIANTKFDYFGVRYPLYNGASPVPTIQNAIKAGFAPDHINVYYISFRASEGVAAGITRMRGAAAGLKAVAGSIGTLWLDIEAPTTYWTSNTKTNCAYITGIVNAIKADKTTFPYKLGIYSGLSTWPQIMGTACPFAAFQDLPFWYAAYTRGAGDFSYWKPMKNYWQRPSIAQWRGTTGFCGAQVDFNVIASN